MAISMQTYVYKSVGDYELKADVYKSREDIIQPAIIWIHGGALMGGTRSDIKQEQVNLYVESGYTVISIDYRLAPQNKIKSIIEDLKDAINWVHHKGPELIRVDPDRIAVIGHSAGGYLTLMSGIIAKNQIKALVSFYGYGDIIGAWYSKPDPYYCSQGLVSKENANRQFYLYCRQNGLWPREVTGYDPFVEPEKIYPYCPIRHITPDYPPALLLHGDIDTDVPCAQSILMAYELLRIGAEHELYIVSGGGHGFDNAKNEVDKLEVDKIFSHVLEFLKRHV